MELVQSDSKSKKQDVKSQISVRFSRDCNSINVHDGEEQEDDIKISLAPYIQVYLAQSSQQVQCCGLSLPIPFERAASRSWWDPRFDSEILEKQYKLSAFPQVRLRFRYSLLYIFVVSLFWCIYLTIKSVDEKGNNDSFSVGLYFGSFSVFTLLTLFLTTSNLYKKYHLSVSVMTSLVMFSLSLMSVGATSVLTPIGDFSICIEILMIIYTVIPLPLYMCVLLAISYSFLFEFFTSSVIFLPVKIFCHVCVHLIGVHILVMTSVRMRGTFMKVGQSLLVRRQLEIEKQLKEKMIHSVMPPKVADWLMFEAAGSGINNEKDEVNQDIRSIFRPFNMHRMENVSILFADIVGFTKMSSNKTAEQLVAILNDLFERFDDLCALNGCEKISTLGDCYYCVSGCPEPRQDHAVCSVEMGLGMIEAIGQFEEQSREGINMRVGVHTGTVLCGIVGTKRVKFDVWSNDVTLANKMESTGKPGTVHVSEKTKEFLSDMYVLEEGDRYQGLKTYFVICRTTTNLTSSLTGSPLTKEQSLVSQPRRSSVSLATAISIHINKTAALEEVLSSSQSLSFRPSFPDQESSYSPTPPPLHPLDSTTISSNARPRSPIQRILQLSSPWKTTSLPSILYTEGSENPDMIPNEESHTAVNRSSSMTKKKVSPKWLYKKVPNSNSPEPEDVLQELLVTSKSQYDTIKEVLVRDDQKSVCPSLNSRKDSGIPSNSRKSSIQHTLYPTNGRKQSDLVAHRVSGYYTSSQSSLNNEEMIRRRELFPSSTCDQHGVCFQTLRKQSDIQLIKCVQDNSLSQRSYFVKQPLHSVSLFFHQKEIEREYRLKAHRSCEDEAKTLATARFNTYLDIAVALVVFLLSSVSCSLLFGVQSDTLPVFLIVCAIQGLALCLCLGTVFWPDLNASLDRFSNWFSWHLIGGVLVSLPVIVVLLFIDVASKISYDIYYFTSFFLVGLIHFCNFTQLNCWMKSIIATIACITYLVVITNKHQLIISHSFGNDDLTNISQTEETFLFPNFNYLSSDTLFQKRNNTKSSTAVFSRTEQRTKIVSNRFTHPLANQNFTESENHFRKHIFKINDPTNVTAVIGDNFIASFFGFEIYLDILLLLLLVWFLNREFEISYRLSFHGNIVAARDKAKMQVMKDQAELLLHNIIPKHVAEHLKSTAKYSENVYNAGIIFASIINFSEMYDESYLGGLECLRVLNELVSDFDELLNKPEFSCVEKIKTIGSTYMAASGLNSNLSRPSHLHTLMEFALTLQAAVDTFNKDLLSFSLILRIGYNFGDVTAGVIGTTKLFYDIWGDAVNIASRMDSTGVAGRVQLPGHCVPTLEDKYEFERRGQVFVKGKDNMVVYLLIGQK